MSTAMNRHKIRRYLRSLDTLDGEVVGAASDDASFYSNLIADLSKTAGGIASSSLAKQEAEKNAKAAADKRAEAVKAAGAANEAMVKAAGEADKSGPLHRAADEAVKKAAQLDAEARGLEGLPPQSPGAAYMQPASSGFPTWGWYAVGGVGALVVGTVIYKLVAGGGHRRGYYSYGGR